jgi:hypothetical protein
MRFLIKTIPIQIALVLIGCSPINKSKNEIIMEEYINAFPNDIVKTVPGCLKPDFTKVQDALPNGSATIRVTFTSYGSPLKSEIVQSTGSNAQNRLIADTFMKCSYEKDPVVKIPEQFQREYLYSWNAKPLAGLNRCMLGSQPYPMQSRRYHEEGAVVAAYYINSKTNTPVVSISQSTGFELLDQATKKTLENCLAHDIVKADIKKDEWIFFKQIWKIN